MDLLHRLREHSGQFLPLSTLGDDPTSVSRDLDDLESFGFSLERHPYHGVAYLGPSDRLCPDQIEWGLSPSRIGRRVAVWNRVTSTNDLALNATRSRANDGLVILAEEQTAGRGRRGRAWSAPPKASILLSALIDPPPGLQDIGWLTALGSVASAEVVEQATDHPARIKWPNDVRVEGRKLAGILVERRSGAVIGIGLNVNLPEDAFPPHLRPLSTSLSRLSGRKHDRSELACCLIQTLDRLYVEALKSGPSPLARRWQARLEPLGRAVTVSTHQGPVRGRLLKADLIDGLILETEDGASLHLRNADILDFDPPEAPQNWK
jgi:BirA family biotin operon repressor/biotin-[acetyl-CoA-carboxylase] ligase